MYAATSWVLNGDRDYDVKLGFRLRDLSIKENMLGSQLANLLILRIVKMMWFVML